MRWPRSASPTRRPAAATNTNLCPWQDPRSPPPRILVRGRTRGCHEHESFSVAGLKLPRTRILVRGRGRAEPPRRICGQGAHLPARGCHRHESVPVAGDAAATATNPCPWQGTAAIGPEAHATDPANRHLVSTAKSVKRMRRKTDTRRRDRIDSRPSALRFRRWVGYAGDRSSRGHAL